MSRAPLGFAGCDIRSAAILQDYLYETDPCTPGAEVTEKCGRTYISECGVPPCGFDKSKYLLMSVMSMLVVAVTVGLMNCFGLYISFIEVAYGMGFIEICFVVGLTYLIMIKISCLGCVLIAWIGHRQTALFGMIMVFIALVLDAFTFHVATFYIAYLIFFGIGAGLAYASAISLAGDLFRKYLATAKFIISIGSCIGTILLYWFNLFLLNNVSYRWTKLVMALIVIMFTGASHLFPNFIIDVDCGIVSGGSAVGRNGRNNEIKASVRQAARTETACTPTAHPGEKSYLCVCVCDIALWSDWSFVLWGVCVLIATMALFLPYMYILAFADTIPILLSPWYITALCIGSIIGRSVVLLGYDFTFTYNRVLFMASVIGSGILWICVPFVETFGWLCIWCLLMGIIEGLIVGCIPRLTLLTLPKIWVESSWTWILWFHAIGVFIVTVFVAVVAREALDFFVAFVAIGIIQIIGGLMAILLPNEDDCDQTDEDCEEEAARGGCGDAVSFPRSPCADIMSYKPRNYSSFGCSSYKGTLNEKMSAEGTSYVCSCPICKAAGCFSECPGCIPAGLAGGPGGRPLSGGGSQSKSLMPGPSCTSSKMTVGGGCPSKAVTCVPSSSKISIAGGGNSSNNSNKTTVGGPSNTGTGGGVPKTQPSANSPPPAGSGQSSSANPYYPANRGQAPTTAPTKESNDDGGVVKRTTYEIKKTTNPPQ